MTDIFTPQTVETNNDQGSLEVVAQKFGVQLTPETEKIVKAKAESDAFIARLQQEQEELRQELTRRVTAEELMTKITSQRNEPAPPQSTPPGPQTEDTDINKIVETKLREQMEAERRRANEAQAVSKLIEKFGSDSEANIKLNQKAKELGLTVADMKRQAQENPAVFFRLMDVEVRPAAQHTPPAPRSSQQAPVSQVNSGVRDRAYYEKLKVNNPKYYFSSEGLQQRYHDEFAARKAGKEW